MSLLKKTIFYLRSSKRDAFLLGMFLGLVGVSLIYGYRLYLLENKPVLGIETTGYQATVSVRCYADQQNGEAKADICKYGHGRCEECCGNPECLHCNPNVISCIADQYDAGYGKYYCTITQSVDCGGIQIYCKDRQAAPSQTNS